MTMIKRSWLAFSLLVTSISSQAIPFNDEIDNALLLTGNGSFIQDNTGATASLPSQFGGSIENDIWFTFFGNDDTVTLSTSSAVTNFDTQFFLWTGYDGSSYSSLGQLLYDDDGGSLGLTSFLSFSASSGTQYWLGLDGYGGSEGTFELLYAVGSNPVPVSGTLGLLGLGLAGLGWSKRKKA